MINDQCTNNKNQLNIWIIPYMHGCTRKDVIYQRYNKILICNLSTSFLLMLIKIFTSLSLSLASTFATLVPGAELSGRDTRTLSVTNSGAFRLRVTVTWTMAVLLLGGVPPSRASIRSYSGNTASYQTKLWKFVQGPFYLFSHASHPSIGSTITDIFFHKINMKSYFINTTLGRWHHQRQGPMDDSVAICL